MMAHNLASGQLEKDIPVQYRAIPLEKDDAEKIAKAATRVMRHFEIMKQTQRTMDIAALISVCAMVYSAIFMMWLENRRRLLRGDFNT